MSKYLFRRLFFIGVVTVADFYEDDPEQDYIPPRSFYQRYTLESKARKLLVTSFLFRKFLIVYSRLLSQPKPGSKTCVCSIPYVPEDIDPSKLMHFCPRPSCRIAYHENCLLNIKSHDPSPIASPRGSRSPAKSARKHASVIYVKRRSTAVDDSQSRSRALRLLACSPDTDDEVDLESLIPITTILNNAHHESDTEIEPPKKKRRGRPKNILSSPSEVVLQQPHTLIQVLSTLPPDLLQVAQQPLVRGGAFAKGGVAGNIGAVTRARRIVYHVLECGEVPDDWEEKLFGKDGNSNVDNAIVKLKEGKMVSPLLCPKCKSAI